MKKIYIQKELGEFADDWTHCAFKGAQSKGYKIIFFEDINEVPKGNHLVIAWIDNTISFFEKNGIKVPEALNIPLQLHKPTQFLGGRVVTETTARYLKEYPERFTWPLFIKPKIIKKFASGVLSKPDSIRVILNDAADNDICIVSKVIDMASEWRAFVIDGEMVGLQWYSGDFKIFPNVRKIQEMIDAYTDSPIAYTLDVAVVCEIESQNTVLVECNDAWAICNYGLTPEIYIKMLEKRWAEIFKNT